MKYVRTPNFSDQFRSSLSVVKLNMELLTMNIINQPVANNFEQACLKMSSRVLGEVKKMTRLIEDSIISERQYIGDKANSKKKLNVDDLLTRLFRELDKNHPYASKQFIKSNSNKKLLIDANIVVNLIIELMEDLKE